MTMQKITIHSKDGKLLSSMNGFQWRSIASLKAYVRNALKGRGTVEVNAYDGDSIKTFNVRTHAK